MKPSQNMRHRSPHIPEGKYEINTIGSIAYFMLFVKGELPSEPHENGKQERQTRTRADSDQKGNEPMAKSDGGTGGIPLAAFGKKSVGFPKHFSLPRGVGSPLRTQNKICRLKASAFGGTNPDHIFLNSLSHCAPPIVSICLLLPADGGFKPICKKREGFLRCGNFHFLVLTESDGFAIIGTEIDRFTRRKGYEINGSCSQNG